MPPRATGQVIQRRWKNNRTYALRFLAYQQRHYLTLGSDTDGWTRERAEDELANIMADVRRGTWTPPAPTDRSSNREDAPTGEPTFHCFASDWLDGRRGEIRPRTLAFYQWALSDHLLPYFAHWQLGEITIESVDAYRRHKLNQSEQRRHALERAEPIPDRQGQPLRPLAASTINKTIDALQAVLALAVEYGHLASNPAAGKRRRLKEQARRPVHLDTAEQIQALLDAAGELDSRPGAQTTGRRALIATLVLAGPRAHEACGLLWRDVDLANGRLYIGRSKTTAGLREIPLLPILRDELATHRAANLKARLDDPVFPSASGRPRDKDNLRNRVVEPAVRRADQLLAQRSLPPLPAGLTPHKLRHTFASILVACGEDPASVMTQLGHTDPKFTLRVYTHLMRRGTDERQRLKALVRGGEPVQPPPSAALTTAA